MRLSPPRTDAPVVGPPTDSPFERAFTDAPVGMLLLRDGRIARANLEFAQVVGRSPDALVGRDPLEFVHPGDRSAARRCLAQLEAGRAIPEQDRRILGPDDVHHMRVRCSLLPEDGLVLLHLVDRTAQVRASRERERARALLQTSFAAAPIGMALLHPNGRFLQVNAALCSLFGLPVHELLSRDFPSLTHPDDLASDLELYAECLAGERDGYVLDKRYVAADGRTIEAQLSVTVVRDADGAVSHVVGQVVDLTELNRARRQVQQLADHDALTGLLNRRRFDDELRRERARVRRSGGRSAVLLLDLDGFKAVNDRHGHAAGDRLLKRIAGALRSELREVDVVARIGGDEFAVLLPDADPAGARATAEKLERAVARNGRVADSRVTASVGVAPVDPDQPADRSLAAADRAMYERKRAARS
jgi:diguanylate cyclase (GGDEF)-like protein/PAS domain S-box-containing protein